MEPTQNVTVKKSQSGLIISIVIVLVLLVGAVMLFGSKRTVENVNDGNNQFEADLNGQVNGMSSSDETSDIEADLNSNGDIDSIDSDFK